MVPWTIAPEGMAQSSRIVGFRVEGLGIRV